MPGSPVKINPTPVEQLHQLVENRTVIDFEQTQLNIFETHQYAEEVKLRFDDLVITSMISGKKIMHLKNQQPFDYFPGQSVIVEPGELMKIDFPEANIENPTQCIALAIAKEKVTHIVDRLNEAEPKAQEGLSWDIDAHAFHLDNGALLNDAICQLVNVSLYDRSVFKGKLAELKTEEVIIRLMQTQARYYIESKMVSLTNHPLAAVINYIKSNLDQPISIEHLCRIANMSKAVFYRKFVNELGVSPASYIMYQRVKHAQWMLANTTETLTSVAFAVGFNNISHFTTLFKKLTGNTPGWFKKIKKVD